MKANPNSSETKREALSSFSVVSSDKPIPLPDRHIEELEDPLKIEPMSRVVGNESARDEQGGTSQRESGELDDSQAGDDEDSPAPTKDSLR